MERVRYGLQLPNGELARLKVDDDWNVGKVEFSSNPLLTVFEVDDVATLELLLANPPTADYETSMVRPSLGEYGPHDLQPVKIVTRAEPVEAKRPVVLERVVDNRKVPAMLARIRVGRGFETTPDTEYRQVLAELPRDASGRTCEIRAGDLVLTTLLGLPHETLRVLGVGQVPEEWTPEFEDADGTLLICTPVE